MRAASFDWLERQVDQYGQVLPRELLARGFTFGGQRVPLVAPQGIFKPRVLQEVPLSIASTPEGPYDDTFSPDGLLRYRYRGTNPDHPDNRGLRLAMQRGLPLVYLHGLVPGRYIAEWPIFVVGDHAEELAFSVAVDDPKHLHLTHGVGADQMLIRDDEGEVRRAYVTPHIGSLPLLRLAPMQVQELYRHLLSSGRRLRAGGLSGTTVALVHTILHRALDQAAKWQIIPRNPCDAVDPPRPDEEARALTTEETARLLLEARTTRHYLPVLLALGTGLRRGEVLGLRWCDVDLDAAVLRVHQAAKSTETHGIFFAEPKTTRSRRTMTLPPTLVEALVREKGRQAQKKLLLGSAYQDHGLVVCHNDGRPESPKCLTGAFRAIARRADFPGLTFHMLRHTHASQLGQAGVPPHVVKERLGHSNVSITLDLYSHVFPSMEREAASKAEEVLRAAVGE